MVDPKLRHPCADSFAVTELTALKSQQPSVERGLRLSIFEFVEPFMPRTLAIDRLIEDQLPSLDPH